MKTIDALAKLLTPEEKVEAIKILLRGLSKERLVELVIAWRHELTLRDIPEGRE